MSSPFAKTAVLTVSVQLCALATIGHVTAVATPFFITVNVYPSGLSPGSGPMLTRKFDSVPATMATVAAVSLVLAPREFHRA